MVCILQVFVLLYFMYTYFLVREDVLKTLKCTLEWQGRQKAADTRHKIEKCLHGAAHFFKVMVSVEFIHTSFITAMQGCSWWSPILDDIG